MCSDGRIGAIVLLPRSSKSEKISVRVVTGVGAKYTAENCLRDEALQREFTEGVLEGCIIARRTLNFIPQPPLYLPVTMRGGCLGEPCDPNSTCVKRGSCIPAEIPNSTDCATPGACEFPDPTGGAGGAGTGGSGGTTGTAGAGGSVGTSSSSGTAGAGGTSTSSSSGTAGAGGANTSGSSTSSSSGTAGMGGSGGAGGVGSTSSSSGMGGGFVDADAGVAGRIITDMSTSSGMGGMGGMSGTGGAPGTTSSTSGMPTGSSSSSGSSSSGGPMVTSSGTATVDSGFRTETKDFSDMLIPPGYLVIGEQHVLPATPSRSKERRTPSRVVVPQKAEPLRLPLRLYPRNVKP